MYPHFPYEPALRRSESRSHPDYKVDPQYRRRLGFVLFSLMSLCLVLPVAILVVASQ